MMFRKWNFWLVITILPTVSGCASHFRLKSTPDKARVELIQNDSQNSILLGETPIQLSKNDISEKQNSGPYRIRISKDGFASREIIFAGISALEADLNFELTQNVKSIQVNQIIDQLFEAQGLAQKGEYQKSLALLNDLQKTNSEISSVYEMRASIFMVKGDFSSAVRDLTQALSINPGDKNLMGLMEAARSKLKETNR